MKILGINFVDSWHLNEQKNLHPDGHENNTCLLNYPLIIESSNTFVFFLLSGTMKLVIKNGVLWGILHTYYEIIEKKI